MSDHAALDSGGFGAHPCTLTRPWRVVFDGLVKAFKQWRRWQIGTIHEVGWIAEGTTPGISITAAIPPIFEAYATCYEPDGVTIIAHERALVERLAEVASDQLWWLGYLDTGAHSVVFEHAPKVLLYWNWPYVLVAAGLMQALSWRTGHMRGAGKFPTCFFPKIDPGWSLPSGTHLDVHRRTRRADRGPPQRPADQSAPCRVRWRCKVTRARVRVSKRLRSRECRQRHGKPT